MNIESIRDYCLSLPMVTEDMAFGEDHLLFRICEKIFACAELKTADYLTVKSDPEDAIRLREQFADIEPAWHWNKKYWIQLNLNGNLHDDHIKNLIRKSYSEVVKKLPKRIRTTYPEIAEVTAEV
ncbi:MAG: MmcQ/YjbR family DNA-binding protein [Muribaculaceae bacterium]|nr:MmcQ/YjbR family DNA-binding protein [Muribaculaceae bacterium]